MVAAFSSSVAARPSEREGSQIRGACGFRAAGQLWRSGASPLSQPLQCYAIEGVGIIAHVDSTRSRDFLAQCDEQPVCHLQSGSFATLQIWRNRFGGDDALVRRQQKWPPSLSERALRVTLDRQRRFTGHGESLAFQSESSFYAIVPAVVAKIADFKEAMASSGSLQTSVDLWHFLHEVGQQLVVMHAEEIVHRSVEQKNISVRGGQASLDGFATSCLASDNGENQQMEPCSLLRPSVLGGERSKRGDLVALALAALEWADIWPQGSPPSSDPIALRCLEGARVGPQIDATPSLRLSEQSVFLQGLIAHQSTWDRIRTLSDPLPRVFESILRRDGSQAIASSDLLQALRRGASHLREKPASWHGESFFRGAQRDALDGLVGSIKGARSAGNLRGHVDGVSSAPLCFSSARIAVGKRAAASSTASCAAMAGASVGLISLAGAVGLTVFAVKLSWAVFLGCLGAALLLFLFFFKLCKTRITESRTVVEARLANYPGKVEKKAAGSETR